MNRIDMNIDLYDVSIKYPKLNHDSIIVTAKLKNPFLSKRECDRIVISVWIFTS